MCIVGNEDVLRRTIIKYEILDGYTKNGVTCFLLEFAASIARYDGSFSLSSLRSKGFFWRGATVDHKIAENGQIRAKQRIKGRDRDRDRGSWIKKERATLYSAIVYYTKKVCNSGKPVLSYCDNGVRN